MPSMISPGRALWDALLTERLRALHQNIATLNVATDTIVQTDDGKHLLPMVESPTFSDSWVH